MDNLTSKEDKTGNSRQSSSVFRAIKSWVWSEGRNGTIAQVNGEPTWFVRAYALPVFSANAQARWREAGTFSGVIWDSRHLQGQAIRLQRVKTIMQMEVTRQHYSDTYMGGYGVVRKGCERMDGVGYTSIF